MTAPGKCVCIYTIIKNLWINILRSGFNCKYSKNVMLAKFLALKDVHKWSRNTCLEYSKQKTILMYFQLYLRNGWKSMMNRTLYWQMEHHMTILSSTHILYITMQSTDLLSCMKVTGPAIKTFVRIQHHSQSTENIIIRPTDCLELDSAKNQW